MKEIAIIGSGSFGCALAQSLSEKNRVKVWSFKEEEANIINKEHRCMFIEGSKLNNDIICYTDYKKVIENTDYIVIATPSSVVRKTIIDIKKYITNQKIVIASKGLEVNTNKLLSEVIKEEVNNEVGILSGPSLAKEIINNEASKVVFASSSNTFNNEIKELFETNTLKIELSKDVIGVEVGGALKNIGALAYGIFEGLNLGENIKSVLITEILDEIKNIGISLGAKEQTFYGLSGLGDLILTCLSKNSRNNKAGILLSQGKSIEEIKEEIGMVVEGFDALKVAYKISNDNNINTKIISKLYDIVYNNDNVKELINVVLK